ncbi:MGH1-like glycoside hydrolase domain-containing protein [Mastigocoleus testarum]|uniref:Glucosidase n=1 Tax=Mastigocoleus testarum BC008 TaxID=371196 RepID=A0A0V8A0C6_9CYAN|nr:glucosidase [Mastigocoleus testarum]KST66880.1 glucosidase [Mastigocoleus testarum BC008]KST70218.1 glucosidase [Mastigocoleus testarum BC008]
MTAEAQRLEENRERKAYWTRWGPYVSERQWGTVREDYSEDGSAWDYFPHSQSLSRAYRWGEDGIAGICDNHQHLCFALAFWNERDPIIKEKMFGLTGSQGNHGEDVKEYYFYLDNTPTHSYMKYLYKYPQGEYPYADLVEENQRRGFNDPEYELLDTGIFERDRYFDIFIEYAKNTDEDILIKVTAHNRGDEEKPLHILPTLWFRNTWSWYKDAEKPKLKVSSQKDNYSIIEASHHTLGERWLYCNSHDGLLFTENESNTELLFGQKNVSPYVKDGINNYVVKGDKNAVNPDNIGTKFTAHYQLSIPPGESRSIELRLCNFDSLQNPFAEFEDIFEQRKQEANEFYHWINPHEISEDRRRVQRQAFAGMLWTKQFYYYVIEDWLQGDPSTVPPPESRKNGRNSEWKHLFNDDIISMPDKWEYPWYAAWDLAFHLIPLAIVDPDYAKLQLSRLTREWYMHPNGQIPAYEWAFSDVNPPVEAWAAWQIYTLEQKFWGRKDTEFLERIFQKLLLNFTWWVNREDAEGNNVFEGGFLGLDNIGVFDRSSELPTGGHLEQADATSWMGMYCLGMLHIALELAQERPPYEDVASKFFEHFLYIADAMNHIGDGFALWDEEDGFYYDAINFPDGERHLLKVRSLVGLIPLLGVNVIKPETIKNLPGFKKRLEWFIDNRPDLKKNVACMVTEGMGAKRLLALCYATPRNDGKPNKLQRLLSYMFDEAEFLSPYGIRSVSKYHEHNPFVMHVNGNEYRVEYQPAESTSGMFGGNSNWRGPVWFPINYLLLEALQNFHEYLGDDFKVEFPTGSGNYENLDKIIVELSGRMTNIFLRDDAGKRPVFGGTEKFQNDPHWRDYIYFHEYFHGDNGAGLGASHQTGWTGVVAYLIQLCAESKL